MMPKPSPKVKMRIEFTDDRLMFTVSMPITRAQRVTAADHLRTIAGDLEKPWRRPNGTPSARTLLRARMSAKGDR